MTQSNLKKKYAAHNIICQVRKFRPSDEKIEEKSADDYIKRCIDDDASGDNGHDNGDGTLAFFGPSHSSSYPSHAEWGENTTATQQRRDTRPFWTFDLCSFVLPEKCFLEHWPCDGRTLCPEQSTHHPIPERELTKISLAFQNWADGFLSVWCRFFVPAWVSIWHRTVCACMKRMWAGVSVCECFILHSFKWVQAKTVISPKCLHKIVI